MRGHHQGLAVAVGPLRLLPAVDIANGLAVTHRTSAGGDAGVGLSALDACLRWVEAGADWIHLVDLGAALTRRFWRRLSPIWRGCTRA